MTLAQIVDTTACSKIKISEILLLQQQHLIELIRERNIEQALDFAQTNLAEQGEGNPAILSELERTLALLAFECPESSPFGDLLHPAQRQKVSFSISCLLQSRILKAAQIPPESKESNRLLKH